MLKFKTSKRTMMFSMATAKRQRWVSYCLLPNLFWLLFPRTETAPASSQRYLHTPFPIPERLGWAGRHGCCDGRRATSCRLASWLRALGGDLSVPAAGPPPSLAPLGSAAEFPKKASQLHAGSSSWGHSCIFRPTPWTWTSILFCSQIYRVDFDSNILLSLQAQKRVCQQ